MSAALPLHRSGSEKPSVAATVKHKWYDAVHAEPGSTKYKIKNRSFRFSVLTAHSGANLTLLSRRFHRHGRRVCRKCVS